MEVRSSSTVLPGHTAALEKWMTPGGKRSAKPGLLFADIPEPASIR